MPTKAKVLERDVQRICMEYLTLKGWTAFRTNNGAIYNSRTRGWQHFNGRKGFPDIVAFKALKPVMFIECKSNVGVPTKEQKETIELINKTLSVGFVVHSLDELIWQMDKFIN